MTAAAPPPAAPPAPRAGSRAARAGRFLRDFLAVTEIRTKTVGLSSWAVGLALALRDSARGAAPALDLAPAALMLLATFCVDMGTTAWNSYGDWWRGTDDGRFNREADKVVARGERRAGFALFSALGLYAVAIGLGVWIASLRGAGVAALGAAGMAVGLLYSAGKRPISSTPFGELFAGGCLGSLLVALSRYVAAGAWGDLALAETAPSFLFIASILAVNNGCDAEGDKASGRRTLSILVGRKASAALVPALGTAAYIAALALADGRGGFPGLALLPLALGAALSAPVYVRMLRGGFSHERKGASMRAINLAFVAFSAARLASIALG